MRALLKVIAILALAFASTFLIANFTGLLSIEQVKSWLQTAHQLSALYVGIIVILLLFCDLFIAVPTLTITILSGYFLGFPNGAICALIGMTFAGFSGYGLSTRYGDSLFKFLIKDKDQRAEAVATFESYGFAMILMSRAVPIFPEVSACLAGITKMRFSKFLTAWALSTIPYSMIASYAGSVSSIGNPMPAIYTAIGLTATLWTAWFIYNRYQKVKVEQTTGK